MSEKGTRSLSAKEIICIQCPLACRVKLHISNEGVIERITSHQCKEGRSYAAQEHQCPKRILTTTIEVEGSTRPVVPVKSNGGIPKAMLKPCVEFLSTIRVTPPLPLGSIIVSNILGTGVSIVSTDELL